MEFNRRMWLRGAAGFTLAIPFLPSLLEPRAARAGGQVKKRFVAIAVDHGAIRQSNMMPDASKLTETMTYAGHEIRRGDLALAIDGDTARLSPVLSASKDRLTPSLVKKLNVLRGLDVTFYLGHHRGGHLGNYADNDGNLSDEQGIARRATIDHLMAWSPTFYPSLDGIKERSLHLGDGGMSWGYSDPIHRNGPVQANGSEFDSLALFNRIFAPPSTKAGRASVTDLVLEDYKRLRGSNRRLSASDKQRLDDHLDRMNELQRKLKVNASGCGKNFTPTTSSSKVRDDDPGYGTSPSTQGKAWQLLNDVIVAAFACDASRIATMRIGDYHTFSGFAGASWHQDVAHLAWQLDPLDAQNYIWRSRQQIFEHIFVDLMAKLDELPDTDGTVLDSTLMQLTQESGPSTHTPIELPIITAGSAGGFFRTGQYVDYRNLGRKASGDGDNSVETHAGLIYNQWLGTVLQSMGFKPSEYESGDYKGYGAMKFAEEGWYAMKQSDYMPKTAVMGEVLPYLKLG